MEIKTGGNTQKRYGEEMFKKLCLANSEYGLAKATMEDRKTCFYHMLQAQGSLDSFEFMISTLQPGSEHVKELRRKRELINNDYNERIRKWQQTAETIGYLEQYDSQEERDWIEIIALGERLEASWKIYNESGIKNE